MKTRLYKGQGNRSASGTKLFLAEVAPAIEQYAGVKVFKFEPQNSYSQGEQKNEDGCVYFWYNELE